MSKILAAGSTKIDGAEDEVKVPAVVGKKRSFWRWLV